MNDALSLLLWLGCMLFWAPIAEKSVAAGIAVFGLWWVVAAIGALA